jgi:3-hydroxy-9,10-secoandrosta-1,3,5(10)-triene-9,17-dione monooxygenase
VNLGAIVPAGDTPEFRSFLLLADQYRIDDHWHVAGLKATGSKDIVVEETFVPEYRTQSHLDYARGASLSGQERNDGPLYRLPWSVVFNMALAASIVGSASGFVDEWIEHTKLRVAPGVGRLANDPLIQRRLAESSWDVDVAVSLLRSDAQTMWARAEAFETPSMEDRAHLRWNMNRAVERVADACVALYRAASGRTAFVDHPLHSRFQDLQSGLGHAFLVPDPLAKAVGGALLGTDKPEFVL